MLQKEEKNLLTHALALTLFLISFILPYWCYANHNSENFGLFYKLYDGNVYLNVCNDNMGESQCALLKSAKVCGILTFIMGSFSIMVPLVYKRAQLKYFYSFLLNILELIFAIICISFFSNFLKSYLNINDDINFETTVSSKYTYQSGFYLWILGIIVIGSVGLSSIHSLYVTKKLLP